MPVRVSISGSPDDEVVVFDEETPLPASKTLYLSTVVDNQPSLGLNIIEKHDSVAKKVGRFSYVINTKIVFC
jgi:molecular chaperone DnaK (HSP70)